MDYRQRSLDYWEEAHRRQGYDRADIKTDDWLDAFDAILLHTARPVLDLGCGGGNDTLSLLRKGKQVWACDQSRTAVEKLKEHFPEIKDARCVNMLDGLPYADGAFDAVIADLSLHYFTRQDTHRILREIRRVLAPGGHLLFRVNSIRDVNHGAGQGTEAEPHLFETKDGTLKRFFDEADVRDFFREGFAFEFLREETMTRYGTDKPLFRGCVRKERKAQRGAVSSMKEHCIENRYLQVTVADAGAELTGVTDREKNTQRIWTADPAVWNRHAPILFPFVGRVTEGKYRAGGREYPMKTQHGFARDLDFACVEETETSVSHRLTATDWTRERYPYDFALTVTHRLEGRTLWVEWTVENRGEGPMVFSIGGHPGFLLPEGVRKEDCRLFFPGAETLRYRNVNKAGFALPEIKTLSLREGSAPYQADIPDTWIFEDGQVQTAGILLPDGTPFVLLHCDQFPMLAVWANPNGPFLCLEPWIGRTDDEGFSGSIEQKKAVRCLAAGETQTIGYSIEFL